MMPQTCPEGCPCAAAESLNLLEGLEPETEALIAAALEAKKIKVAIDSAAVANVIHPEDLPENVEYEPHDSDNHFVGANDSRIERYGKCKTLLSGKRGEVGCDWDMANVTRPLHSVAKVTGPKVGPAERDVLFDNEMCYVVQPGVVKAVMRHIGAVAEYER